MFTQESKFQNVSARSTASSQSQSSKPNCPKILHPLGSILQTSTYNLENLNLCRPFSVFRTLAVETAAKANETLIGPPPIDATSVTEPVPRSNQPSSNPAKSTALDSSYVPFASSHRANSTTAPVSKTNQARLHSRDQRMSKQGAKTLKVQVPDDEEVEYGPMDRDDRSQNVHEG